MHLGRLAGLIDLTGGGGTGRALDPPAPKGGNVWSRTWEGCAGADSAVGGEVRGRDWGRRDSAQRRTRAARGGAAGKPAPSLGERR